MIQQISWTHALREIVINCYKYHGRDDLLPKFSEEEDLKRVQVTSKVTLARDDAECIPVNRLTITAPQWYRLSQIQMAQSP
jgi:hypothetical protein